MSDRSQPLDIARLVEEHHAAVYRYGFRLCGLAADAEDLTQQTFLVAQQKLDQLRSADSARSWLFTVLRNVYLKGRRKRAPITAAQIDLDMNCFADELPEELEFDGERLQKALDELPDEFKLVIMLFYFESCSYREIAQRLDVPSGTVMSRLSRAKGHLRSRLLATPWKAPTERRYPAAVRPA